MIGVDLTRISRFKNVKKQFIVKVLSPNEITEYKNCQDKAKYLAAHWSIKEALFKIDNSLFPYNKIEITKKQEKYCFPSYIITTTNEDDFYFSIVIKEIL